MQKFPAPLVISFSGGRSSAYMTHRLLPDHPGATVIFCNTGKENEETLHFVEQCNQLWQNPVVWLEYHPTEKFRIVNYNTASRNGEPFAALIKEKQMLPNLVARFCTQELKVRAIKHYCLSVGLQHWTSAIGIRYDEPARWSKTKGVASKERWEVVLPMVDWKTTKPDVLQFWKQMPFDLQLKEHEGNCDLCMLKGKYKKLQILREKPHVAKWWIEQEDLTGATFCSRYSIASLVKKLSSAPELFPTGPQLDDYECFCNID